MRDFARDNDAQLAQFWNEQEGALGFLIGVEDELKSRGYATRNSEGQPNNIIPEDGYEANEPKSEGYHDRAAVLWDSRPGK